MGLKKTIKFKGIDVVDAYIKIKHFSGNKDSMCFNTQVYINKETSDNDDQDYIYISKLFYFKPNLDKNLWKQAYDHLKTLDDYKDAVDV